MLRVIRWAVVALILGSCDGSTTVHDPEPDASDPDAALHAGAECTAGSTRPCPDGASGPQTCADGRWANCGPIAETCDGTDEDGDGAVDEGVVDSCGSADGACVTGVRACVAGAWGPCLGAIGPTDETCDGTDEDCDGEVDEAPILPLGSAVASPVIGAPHAMVWTGNEHAIALPGYPNRVLRLALTDGTVWRTDLVGRVPAPVRLAQGPSGLAIMWAERTGEVHFGRLGWADEGLEPVVIDAVDAAGDDRAIEAALAGQTRSTLIAWISQRDDVPWTVIVDPATGEPRFEPINLGGPVGAVDLRVANNSDDGFAAVWRVPAGDQEQGDAVWFARLDNRGAPVSGPFELLPGGARVAGLLTDFYIDAFAVGWSDGERVEMAVFGRDSQVVESRIEVADDQVDVGDVALVRDDGTWGIFWDALDASGERWVFGRLYARGGQPLMAGRPLMPVGERWAVVHGGGRYALSTADADGIIMRGGTLVCPTPDPL